MFYISYFSPFYFGDVIEEESDIPASTIDEFEELLAVLRNLNRCGSYPAITKVCCDKKAHKMEKIINITDLLTGLPVGQLQTVLAIQPAISCQTSFVSSFR